MNKQNYFMEQLCTIGVSGAYAVVMTWMFISVRWAPPGQRSLLSLITPWIQVVVLIGSFVLFFFVIFRAIGVWRAAGQGDAFDPHAGHDHGDDHGHSHGVNASATALVSSMSGLPIVVPDHTHTHDGHAHSHDDGHDHSWSPWRYAVLIFPLLLFLLGLDYTRLISDYEKDLLGRAAKQDFNGPAASGAGDPLGAFALLAFSQSPIDHAVASMLSLYGMPEGPALQQAVNLIEEESNAPPDATFDVDQLEKSSVSEAFRNSAKKYRRVEVQGMYSPMDRRRFQIARMKMACCTADARVVSVFAVSRKPVDPQFPEGQQMPWVKAVGRLDFIQHQGQWKAVLKTHRVMPSAPPANPYLN